MSTLETEWDRARAKVSRSSFYLAMRLMPEERREAMFAIYAFNRAVDEVAHVAHHLLESLVSNSPRRNRETEALKAKARSAKRFSQPLVSSHS